jgi:hypothetical protein
LSAGQTVIATGRTSTITHLARLNNPIAAFCYAIIVFGCAASTCAATIIMSTSAYCSGLHAPRRAIKPVALEIYNHACI